jgi:hypothetical protein
LINYNHAIDHKQTTAKSAAWRTINDSDTRQAFAALYDKIGSGAALAADGATHPHPSFGSRKGTIRH